ncbi:hypothetical protein Csp2054_09040 [Curtobacterium sp. 'Ferrero']|uniref:hypothetical protein n=1 Tax=Curtobacterium sp. 'Ferrero' TaxID=2033654 RepID=UPI000BCC3369|nr:hypothetical protein [Curtobacterium sp. 'Ferrero']PCN48008.1 hypothetical protein Csp2054_09040 [Curtobacterium sp. 'Ferrero']
MADPIVETVYCVARGKQAITSYVTTEDAAANDLYRVQQNMRAAMLEPDVYLATVSKTTSYGEPVEVKA